MTRMSWVGAVSLGSGVFLMVGLAAPSALSSTAMGPRSIDPGFSNELVAVSADSPTDVWTVGSYQKGRHLYTLVERWDGRSWHLVKAPTPPGKLGGQLAAVSALSPIDVWAVGFIVEQRQVRTWVLHWNGHYWRRVPSPSPSGPRRPGQLTGVTAISPSDVWAVGWDVGGTPTHYRMLAEHWDGTSWTVVGTPAVPGDVGGEFTSVSAQSSTNVWATGKLYTRHSIEVLVERWDGHAWTRWAAPSGAGANSASSVSVDAARDAWVAGWVDNPTVGIDRPLILHWDGISWTRTPAPDPGARFGGTRLTGVTAISPTDVWVVGSRSWRASSGTVTEHWDGARWSDVEPADLGRDATALFDGVSAAGSSDVFTVGEYEQRGRLPTLAEKWDGSTWIKF